MLRSFSFSVNIAENFQRLFNTGTVLLWLEGNEIRREIRVYLPKKMAGLALPNLFTKFACYIFNLSCWHLKNHYRHQKYGCQFPVGFLRSPFYFYLYSEFSVSIFVLFCFINRVRALFCLINLNYTVSKGTEFVPSSQCAYLQTSWWCLYTLYTYHKNIALTIGALQSLPSSC